MPPQNPRASLITITDKDFKTVSAVSIVAIFFIIFFVLKSIYLSVILVAAIEFAIFVNMGIPYYTGTTIPFTMEAISFGEGASFKRA